MAIKTAISGGKATGLHRFNAKEESGRRGSSAPPHRRAKGAAAA
jgi:hypothetical protein